MILKNEPAVAILKWEDRINPIRRDGFCVYAWNLKVMGYLGWGANIHERRLVP